MVTVRRPTHRPTRSNHTSLIHVMTPAQKKTLQKEYSKWLYKQFITIEVPRVLKHDGGFNDIFDDNYGLEGDISAWFEAYFENKFNIMLDEDELYKIALMIGDSPESQNVMLKAWYDCNKGISKINKTKNIKNRKPTRK